MAAVAKAFVVIIFVFLFCHRTTFAVTRETQALVPCRENYGRALYPRLQNIDSVSFVYRLIIVDCITH